MSVMDGEFSFEEFWWCYIFFHSEVTYPIHVEAINTLLVMLSVQMFDPNASESSIFFQVVMKGKW